MKTKFYFCGSAVSALLACLCAATARHYASISYTLWLSEQGSSDLLVHSAARSNHFWVATMLAFVFLTGVLVFAGFRSRQRGLVS